ncbi:hypothetical protein EJ02DRAFT_82933 [Clathrospora elynae]|uniref:Uncharacterized protein n=1 Tax=Clathrospora elynae TaxID=706981 RepID=A0A6A5SDE6_9PLEO|nr:hypothetical protein EJ02DRAFT_82933 [Clathrospora elynae]
MHSRRLWISRCSICSPASLLSRCDVSIFRLLMNFWWIISNGRRDVCPSHLLYLWPQTAGVPRPAPTAKDLAPVRHGSTFYSDLAIGSLLGPMCNNSSRTYAGLRHLHAMFVIAEYVNTALCD